MISSNIDWKNLDEPTRMAFYLALKCFAYVNCVQIEPYFNGPILQIWMYFIKNVFESRVPENYSQKPGVWSIVLESESDIHWKLKRVCGQIISK